MIDGCACFEGESLHLVPLGADTPGVAEFAEVTGYGAAPTLSAGISRFVDIDFSWLHPSDEAVFVMRGELSASSGTGTVSGRPGDIMFVSQGARLRWRTTGECTVFVAVNRMPEHLANAPAS